MKLLSPSNVLDFRLLLTEEIVDSKRDILKLVNSLDVKYQVKVLFNVLMDLLECKKTE